MALAAPGQVLLEGFHGFGPELRHKDELTALLPQQPSRIPGDPDYEAVEVLQLGKFPIKASVTCVEYCLSRCCKASFPIDSMLGPFHQCLFVYDQC